jgi:hypothetical protein
VSGDVDGAETDDRAAYRQEDYDDEEGKEVAA